MIAEYTPRSEVKRRTALADVVPIDTPYVVGIFLGDICNFRCKYCIQSLRGEKVQDKDGNNLLNDLVNDFYLGRIFR